MAEHGQTVLEDVRAWIEQAVAAERFLTCFYGETLLGMNGKLDPVAGERAFIAATLSETEPKVCPAGAAGLIQSRAENLLAEMRASKEAVHPVRSLDLNLDRKAMDKLLPADSLKASYDAAGLDAVPTPPSVHDASEGLAPETPVVLGAEEGRYGKTQARLARLPKTFTAKRVAEDLGMESKTAYTFIYRLRKDGLIENLGGGVWSKVEKAA